MGTPTTLLNLRDVTSRTGLSRSSIYRLIDEGDFPKAVKLGKRTLSWPDTEIEDWIQAKLAKR